MKNTTIDEILADEGNYKVCQNCGKINATCNINCWNCGRGRFSRRAAEKAFDIKGRMVDRHSFDHEEAGDFAVRTS